MTQSTRQPTLFDWAHDPDGPLDRADTPASSNADGGLTAPGQASEAAPSMGSASRRSVSMQQQEHKRSRDRQALALHQRLSEELGKVDLHVTDNRRRMITVRRKPGRFELRLHHMFLECSEEILLAVAGFARGDDAAARERIRTFIRDNREVIRRRPCAEKLRTMGEHHDLAEMLERCQEIFPELDLRDVQITWGRDGKGRRSIRFGCFDYDQRLIRMHPALDAGWVPAYFVEFIVYHELCHAVIPPRERNGRRSLHPPEFRALEQQFPEYDQAIAWEEENLHRFLSR